MVFLLVELNLSFFRLPSRNAVHDSPHNVVADEIGKLRLHHEVVNLSASVPASVNRAYHRIWGWVKSKRPDRNILGLGGAYEIVEKMKGELRGESR